MSKITYEEAIEIMKNIIMPREMQKSAKIKVINALQRSQKQEKLLELYIDLGHIFEELDNTFGYGIFEDYEIKNICEKIRELNKDFEEEE